MAEQPKIVTGIGKAELHRILVRGYDLNKELVGKITFTDMTSLILRGRLPTANEAKMLDALMIILVEHGMVSHVIAARLIYHCAPEAMQAAVAAALCGAGSVHLGSSEWSAKMLVDALPTDTQNPAYDEIATKIIDDYTTRKQRAGHRPQDSRRRRPARRDVVQYRQRHRRLWKVLRADSAPVETLEREAQTLDPGKCHRRHRRHRARPGLSLADHQGFRSDRPNPRRHRPYRRRNKKSYGDADRRRGQASAGLRTGTDITREAFVSLDVRAPGRSSLRKFFFAPVAFFAANYLVILSFAPFLPFCCNARWIRGEIA